MTQGNPALPQTRARRPGLPWLPLIHGAAGIPALPASFEMSSQPGLALFSFPRAEKGTSSQKPAHSLMLVLSIPQPHSGLLAREALSARSPLPPSPHSSKESRNRWAGSFTLN